MFVVHFRGCRAAERSEEVTDWPWAIGSGPGGTRTVQWQRIWLDSCGRSVPDVREPQTAAAPSADDRASWPLVADRGVVPLCAGAVVGAVDRRSVRTLDLKHDHYPMPQHMKGAGVGVGRVGTDEDRGLTDAAQSAGPRERGNGRTRPGVHAGSEEGCRERDRAASRTGHQEGR